MSVLEERNAKRAKQGKRAVRAAARAMPEVYCDDAIGNAVDVLTDILHYCDTLTEASEPGRGEPVAEYVARVALANYRGRARRGCVLVRMPPRGHTRLHWAGGRRKGAARLTVPVGIARAIGPERLFRLELTEEGILFRLVEDDETAAPWPEVVRALALLDTARASSPGFSRANGNEEEELERESEREALRREERQAAMLDADGILAEYRQAKGE